MTANSLPPLDNEIDLTALLIKLWKGRKVVTFTTLAGLATAFAYVMNAPQVWVSSATIAPPSYEQMGDYYLIKTQLDTFPLFSKRENNVQRVNILSGAPAGAGQPNEDKDLSEQLFDATRLLLETTPSITLLRPDGRKQHLFQVQASGASPTEAQQNLALSLSNTNLRLAKSKTRELRSQMVLLQSALLNEQQTLARQAEAKRTQELATTRQALDRAKRAGLVQFAGSSYAGLEQPDMHYLLGSKLLQGKLTSLKLALPEYSARYYEITTQLADMKHHAINKTTKVEGFQQVAAPSLPNRPITTNKMIIFALAFLAGALIGCLLVFAKDSLATGQAKLQN